MNRVTIRHPEAGEAQVPESAVPHWRAAGWAVAEPEPQPEPRSEPENKRRRREASNSEES
jgi:hypothetical protein